MTTVWLTLASRIRRAEWRREVSSQLASLSARQVGLGALSLVTAGVLGFSVSAWLVPPYLLLMAWLVGGVGARQAPRSIDSSADPAPAVVAEPPSSEPVAAMEEPARAIEVSRGGGPRRRRGSTRPPGASAGRRRRVAAATVEVVATSRPAVVRWVQVAPGKFVRVEESPEAGLDATDVSPANDVPQSDPVEGPTDDEALPDRSPLLEEPDSGSEGGESSLLSGADPGVLELVAGVHDDVERRGDFAEPLDGAECDREAGAESSLAAPAG
jgi:hypothetical protein